MKFSMKSLGFSNEDNVVVRRKKYLSSPLSHFEIHQVNSGRKLTGKPRDSPSSSILKQPTLIFVTSRNRSTKSKKLKFGDLPKYSVEINKESHGPDDLSMGSVVDREESNGEAASLNDTVEVAISPEETMQVSAEAWKAFLEYKKYNNYSNETEKTDYTYSKYSKFRHKEIIPGFVIRPNLSRPSLESVRSSKTLLDGCSSQTESFISDDYETSAFNKSSFSEVGYDTKAPKKQNKYIRSKYYLRSSGLGVDTENDHKPFPNVENFESESINRASSSFPYTSSDTSSISPILYIKSPENMSSSFLNSGLERNSTSHFKTRFMYLDDSDIDEVDLKDHKNLNGERSRISYQTEKKSKLKSLSQSFGNLFTPLYLFVATIATFPKNLFLKCISKSSNDHIYNSYDKNWERYNKAIASSNSRVPWFGKENDNYYSSTYYSDRYYTQPRRWYQRLYYYLQNSFSSAFNKLWGQTPGEKYRKHFGEKHAGSTFFHTLWKRKFWWLLIPLLLLGGYFLDRIDFFSDPKAILNTIYNGAYYVPSFMYHIVMVFIPQFLTETIPNFFLKPIFYYFSRGAYFFANLSMANVWALFLGYLAFVLQLFTSLGQYLLNCLSTVVTVGYWFSSEYLVLFYSNFCIMFFTLLSNIFDGVLYLF